MSEGIGELESHFHALIRQRAGDLARDLALPSIGDEPGEQWFPVPGMYGGFSYSLHEEGGMPVLIVESWCRVVGGSGQRHRITADGCELVAEGFV